MASGVALAVVIDCTGGLCPGTNNDTMTGTAGFDEISGNTDLETVYGGTGTDTVNTFGGDDFVDVVDGSVSDTVDCHIGTNDTVRVDRRLTIFGIKTDQHINCENIIVIRS